MRLLKKSLVLHGRYLLSIMRKIRPRLLCHVKSLGPSFTRLEPTLGSASQGPYSSKARSLGLYPTHKVVSHSKHIVGQLF